MKKENVSFPDKWKGWRLKNNEIDYNVDDNNYLLSRRNYLLDKVDDSSYKLKNSIDSYSNRQVLAWGCGSGKTTNLKVLCANTDKSTLIIVKTNEEIKRLVFDIKALNPKQSICGIYKGSDTLKELECNIYALSKYRIVVTNNWRALYESSNIFINYDDPIKKEITKRELVIFDEFQTPYTDIVVKHEKLLVELYKRELIYGKEIRLNKETIKNIINFDKNIFNELFNDLPDIKNEKLYHERVSWLFNKLIVSLGDLSNTDISSDIIIHQDINDFIDEDTKLIILDATAEFLFEGSNNWNIERYNQSKVVINNNIYYDTLLSTRRTRKSNEKHKKDIVEDIRKLEKYISMNNGNKHLVITWNNTFHIENLPNFIKENISKDLRDKYEVIHYNSGKCRATNEYIKYDSIIFFGEWFNNSFHAERLSEVLNTKIESKDLVKSEIVQAIFRTQARIGKSVSIAFFTIIMRNYWMDTIHLKKVLIVY
ncbi:DEAD/DEAH box helicase family protein [Haemophilus haemolyticus]|uniref:DEAD/DEAH box helicase family protein n=1 Tax=Haemophilus haemolyticus TaxID=726 RepID=UPI001EFDF71B|nr:DEAD/DEAH box helicase family protein [Haemophilus haemolyticus]